MKIKRSELCRVLAKWFSKDYNGSIFIYSPVSASIASAFIPRKGRGYLISDEIPSWLTKYFTVFTKPPPTHTLIKCSIGFTFLNSRPTFDDFVVWSDYLVYGGVLIQLVPSSLDTDQIQRYAFENGLQLDRNERLDFFFYENIKFRSFIKRKLNLSFAPLELLELLSQFQYLVFFLNRVRIQPRTTPA